MVFPTETVWGLGANALDVRACRRIFEAKGRPQDNPLIVHVATVEALLEVTTSLSHEEEALIARFMPGPLTLVVPRSPRIAADVTGGRADVGVRMPRQAIARALLLACGLPIAAPSANRSGRPSPTTFEMAKSAMVGRADAIIDGPPCEVGLESTVVRVQGRHLHILRPGSLTAEELMEATPNLTPVLAYSAPPRGAPQAPGLKYAHYKPNARVVAIETEEELTEVVQALAASGPIGILWPQFRWNSELVETLAKGVVVRGYADLDHYARNLFAWFHELDQAGVASIVAHLPTDEGVGRALCNRILKAAEPRNA